VPWLEERYRSDVVKDYHGWIISVEGQQHCQLLTRWAPDRIPKLLHDATLTHYKQVNEEYDKFKERSYKQLEGHCKPLAELLFQARRVGLGSTGNTNWTVHWGTHGRSYFGGNDVKSAGLSRSDGRMA
jgi:hypothetical protein